MLSLITSFGATLLAGPPAYANGVGRVLALRPNDWTTLASFGVVGDGVADDTVKIENAINSGVAYVHGAGRHYKITRPLNLGTSGVTIDLTGSTLTQTTVNAGGLIIGYDGKAFVKTDNVTIIGGTMRGADNGLTSTVGVGISVYNPPVRPYAEGAGCSHIKIRNTRFDGWCMSFAATGADHIDIDGIHSTNTKYHASVAAGGYGVLAQTCFDIKIGARCVFKATTNCRHAIYISADPGLPKAANNTCNRVSIGACLVDWAGTAGTTGFEAGIFLRSASNVNIDGPTVIGAYAGVLYDLENGACDNITITRVHATRIRASAGENAGVGFLRSSGAFRAKNVTVTECTVQLESEKTHGIQLAHIDGVTSGGHSIGRSGERYLSGQYTVDCTDVVLAPSKTWGKLTAGALAFAGEHNRNIRIERQVFVGSGPKYKFYTTPALMRLD